MRTTPTECNGKILIKVIYYGPLANGTTGIKEGEGGDVVPLGGKGVERAGKEGEGGEGRETALSIAKRMPAKTNKRQALRVDAAHLTTAFAPPRLHHNVMVLKKLEQLLNISAHRRKIKHRPLTIITRHDCIFIAKCIRVFKTVQQTETSTEKTIDLTPITPVMCRPKGPFIATQVNTTELDVDLT